MDLEIQVGTGSGLAIVSRADIFFLNSARASEAAAVAK